MEIKSILLKMASSSESDSTPKTKRTLDDLPDNVLLDIFKKLSHEDLLRCKLVSRRWRELFHSKSLRKNVFLIANFGPETNIRTDFPEIMHYFGPLGYTGMWVRLK